MSIQNEIDRIEQNVADTYSVLAEAGAPMPASMDSDNLAGTAANIAAILYNKAQSLTNNQQAQGRNNINAITGSDLTLAIGADGLLYIFAKGVQVGNGIDIATAGDIIGYVDANNNVVLKGNLADGTYSIKYEMENGNTVNIGNLVLDTRTYYSVTNNLTQCTNSNSATKIAQGESYSATITANSGYELKSVTATMGGNTVSVSNGKINISNVTGNIVITAVAEEAQAAEPVTENITLLKDTSLKGTNYDEDRTGTSGFCATPSIDLANVPKPCTIHLTGACWAYADTANTGYIRFSVLNTSGTRLSSGYTHKDNMPSGVTMVYNDTARNDVIVTVTGSNVGKVRFAAAYGSTGTGSGTGNFADAKATLTYTLN